MDNRILLLTERGICKVAHASADLHALRKSGLNLENLDTAFRAIRPRAHSDDYDRTRRDRACIRPASPRRNVQKAHGPDRVQARLLRPDPHSAATHARWCGGSTPHP